MPTFTPPVAFDNPPFLPDSPPSQVGLFRHYAPLPRGVNVFMLSDGSFVQDTGTPENNDTNVPYPWNIDDPSGPYSYVTNWDGTIITAAQDPYIVSVFYGGHTYEVDAGLAAALAAAGYGADIS